MLYATLLAILKIPYKSVSQPGPLPLPLQRLFLEMTVRIIQSTDSIIFFKKTLI